MWTGSLNQASRFRARASALSSVTRPTPAVAVELLIGRLWKHQPHWTEVPAFQVFRTGERCREQSTSAGQTNRVHTVPITFATFFLLFLWTRVANRVKTSQRQRFVLNDAILCFHWPNNFITNGENVTDMRVWLETKSVNANFSVSITVTLLCSIYIQLGRSVWFVKPTLQSIEWKSAHFAYLTGCTVYIRVDCPTNFFFLFNEDASSWNSFRCGIQMEVILNWRLSPIASILWMCWHGARSPPNKMHEADIEKVISVNERHRTTDDDPSLWLVKWDDNVIDRARTI